MKIYKKYDVIVVGGGAAGLAAASLLDSKVKACIIEKNKTPGRKIAATGGGRCNITNRACENRKSVLDFFKSLGLETYCDEEGRYYPYSNKASDVTKVLLDEIQRKKIDIVTEASVENIATEDGRFLVDYTGGNRLACDYLVLATGGKAAPQFGTTGDGYRLARNMGHSIKKIYPILTGIQCGDFHSLKGVRARGRVSLYKDDVMVAEETGEIQFNESGISGICVMNLTLNIKGEKGEAFEDMISRYSLLLDMAPDFTEEEISKRTTTFGILSEKLSGKIGLDEIKHWKLPIKGVNGWKDAQSTAGGVDIDEINIDTMESKIKNDLYIIGEILDIQGPCGGYNLQNAWETAIKAAKHINSKGVSSAL